MMKQGLKKRKLAVRKMMSVQPKIKKGDTIPPKEDEPKLEFKTLPFPQRYIRRNLNK